MDLAIFEDEMNAFCETGSRAWGDAYAVFLSIRREYGPLVLAGRSVPLRPERVIEDLDLPRKWWPPTRMARVLKLCEKAGAISEVKFGEARRTSNRGRPVKRYTFALAA